MTTALKDEAGDLPESLWRDRSFWGITVTQFLGAFNDNLYKEAALLVCTDVAPDGEDYQKYAMAAFALPFVLFSGFAGYLADRNSKRRIIVLCKIIEVAIVAFGAAAMLGHRFHLMIVALFLMGTHSAFFGPSKYGILPEIVREKNLPLANGIFLMTTFLAVIFGMGAAGFVKEPVWDHQQWQYSASFLVVAITGVATSIFVRKTPAAHPHLRFKYSDIAVSGETLGVFRRDRPLLTALVINSLFWLVAGVVQPVVNEFGKKQLDLGDRKTALMLACLSFGIAVGCATAGKLSHQKVNFRLIPCGAWGICISLTLVAIAGYLPLGADFVAIIASMFLMLVGGATGVFSVPIQVFLQERPPRDQRGRVLGAMNLFNWVGIFLSAGVYGLFVWLNNLPGLHFRACALFIATAFLMLPIALFYRPRETPRPGS
jgi:acyl-[acyl-carrier-protein]-phospholipid O-acyltransferase/long-chain-fatty-acid--[acyl-carrier-protein] ligase